MKKLDARRELDGYRRISQMYHHDPEIWGPGNEYGPYIDINILDGRIKALEIFLANGPFLHEDV